jgi:hypothetical protein
VSNYEPTHERTTPEARATISDFVERCWMTVEDVAGTATDIAEYPGIGGPPRYAVTVSFAEPPTRDRAVSFLAGVGAAGIVHRGSGDSHWVTGAVTRAGTRIEVTVHYDDPSEVEQLRAQLARQAEEIARLRGEREGGEK